MTSNQALEQYLQEKVNEVAKMLIELGIELDLETAENNPKQIGKMAKMMVFDAMNKAIDEHGS